MYNFFIYIFDIYCEISYCFNEIKKKYITKKTNIFFELSNVCCTTSKEDVTNIFLSNNKIDFSHNKIYCFDWIFDNKIYKQFLNEYTIHNLFPYTFFSIRNTIQEHKIISALITDNNTNNIYNKTKYIKMIAGPKQNFFNDIYQIHSDDIFGLQSKTLQIVTIKKTYIFDLSKDNVLEL